MNFSFSEVHYKFIHWYLFYQPILNFLMEISYIGTLDLTIIFGSVDDLW